MATLIHEWLQQDALGETLRQHELQFLRANLADKRGKTLITLGPVAVLAELELSRFPRQWQIAASPPADVLANLEALPLAPESVDVILCPHGLEYSGRPAAVLSEIARVLKPEGWLMVTAFNPHRLWLKDPTWERKKIVRKAQCLSPGELTRELREVSLQVMFADYLFYEPLIAAGLGPGQVKRLELAANRWWPHLAKVYGLVAKKTVFKPIMRPLPQLLAAAPRPALSPAF